ncbi:MAG: hypothetical protein I3270_00885 [Candidatus Moeniiplasma glomeromycotorum]|nr:hypothetical protein [Candidatus Moeniiplasma glomeromycotorum]MCE8162153.1 hypothetical protein [Candidatus Moeniiplasma glomeromycotorum]MCE8166192.1 hypothetical protein [Candidatus Moeniiplasma glomeromycotorum]
MNHKQQIRELKDKLRERERERESRIMKRKFLMMNFVLTSVSLQSGAEVETRSQIRYGD